MRVGRDRLCPDVLEVVQQVCPSGAQDGPVGRLIANGDLEPSVSRADDQSDRGLRVNARVRDELTHRKLHIGAEVASE